MKELKTKVFDKEYTVKVGTIDELGLSEDLSGECSYYLNLIKIEDSMRRCEDEIEKDGRTSNTVAHEIFHAFIHESGFDLPEDVEERLAVWFACNWRRMNNSIIGILDELDILDIM